MYFIIEEMLDVEGGVYGEKEWERDNERERGLERLGKEYRDRDIEVER